MSLKRDIIRYYNERASDYDETAGFTDAAGEKRRGPIKARYRRRFRGLKVLEIACGTGYWTAVIGGVAASVLAIDINRSLLAQAVDRCRYLSNVSFQIADAYTLEGINGDFDAAVGLWWWSHMPKENILTFLKSLHGRLQAGTLVMFSDQLPYAASYREKDRNGNVLERRVLPNGRSFMIVKNFPDEREIRSALAGLADDVRYTPRPEEGSWEVLYRVKKPG